MASPQTDLEKKAGISSFEKFGYINILNSLSGGDILKWAAIMNLPYETVFLKQLHVKTEADFQKKYAALMKKGE